MNAATDSTRVLIITSTHRITGNIALVPGARLTDFVRDDHQHAFIAMTDVLVTDLHGHETLRTPFLDVGKTFIEMIMPADGVLFL
jgi:hypothetical protein